MGYLSQNKNMAMRTSDWCMHSLQDWEVVQDAIDPVGPERETSVGTYEVTYCVSEVDVDRTLLLSRLLSELQGLRESGTNIKLQAVTDDGLSAIQRVSVTAWFAAPTIGDIGRLNYNANLPACGIRRIERGD